MCDCTFLFFFSQKMVHVTILSINEINEDQTNITKFLPESKKLIRVYFNSVTLINQRLTKK